MSESLKWIHDNFPDDEIRQSEGFKNVNLGNVISSSYKADKKTAFLTMEDHILLEKIGVAAFELQVLNVGLRHFRWQFQFGSNSKYPAISGRTPRAIGSRFRQAALPRKPPWRSSQPINLKTSQQDIREGGNLRLSIHVHGIKLRGVPSWVRRPLPQVWSPTQFFPDDFSQSRIGV